MGYIGSTLSITRPNDGKCDCLWGQNECPNLATTIFKNRTNAGFMIACDAHAIGFEQDYPGLCESVPYDSATVTELTDVARKAGLK